MKDLMNKTEQTGRTVQLLLSFCFVVSHSWYFFRESMFGIGSVFNILIFICVYKLIMEGLKTNGRALRFGLAFGLIFSLALVIGKPIFDTDDIRTLYATPEAIAYNALSLFSFTAVFGMLSALMLEATDSAENAAAPARCRIHPAVMFCAVWAFIFLCWVPVYLAYYPGRFAYDMPWQTLQAFGLRDITRDHPVLHTFLWRLCLMAADFDITDGLKVYSLAQMLIMSAIFAAVIVFFVSRRLPRWLILMSALFFALHPSMSIFSFATTKDVIFGGLFVLLTIEMCCMVSDPGKFLGSKLCRVAFVLTGMFACLVRNNCLHALVLSAPVCALLIKHYRTKTLALFAAAIVCFVFVNGYVYDRLGVAQDRLRDVLSLPMQQISRVVSVHKDDFSEAEKGDVSRFISFDIAVEHYNPRFVDTVKWHFNVKGYDDDSYGFWELWYGLLKRYPADYVSALLSLNMAFWYPDSEVMDSSTGYRYMMTKSRKVSICGSRRETFEPDSRLPALLEMYESLIGFNTVGGLPLIPYLFAIKVPFWLMMFSMISLMYRGFWRGLAALMPSFMLWATFMAGPVSLFRYIFPLFALYPVFIALVLYPQQMLGQQHQ